MKEPKVREISRTLRVYVNDEVIVQVGTSGAGIDRNEIHKITEDALYLFLIYTNTAYELFAKGLYSVNTESYTTASNNFAFIWFN